MVTAPEISCIDVSIHVSNWSLGPCSWSKLPPSVSAPVAWLNHSVVKDSMRRFSFPSQGSPSGNEAGQLG